MTEKADYWIEISLQKVGGINGDNGKKCLKSNKTNLRKHV